MSISGNILTEKGGAHEIPQEMRHILCYMEDGRFFVSKAHVMDPRVASIRAKFQRLGMAVNVMPVDMQTIQSIYDGTNKKQGGSADSPSKIQQYATKLFHTAVLNHASDIHIRVSEKDRTKIWFRIHNDMTFIEEQSEEFGVSLCTAIYQSMCDISDTTFNVRSRQDARISNGGGQMLPPEIDGIRVATAPQVGGLIMVMRLLYNDTNGMSEGIATLGYRESDINAFSLMKQRPFGINIIAGPTGSGKSTTLTRLLVGLIREVNNTKHIITVEDPPEYPMPGIIQTPVSGARGEEERSREFEAAISSAMRLDPDIIMIGEVRDSASARLALRAAMTGHQVWATVHANRAMSIIDRMHDLGTPMDMLTDPSIITGLSCQRLVKTLCQKCKKPLKDVLNFSGGEGDDNVSPFSRKAIDRILAVAKLDEIYVTGNGCSNCGEHGTTGRTVVAETITPDEEFMRHIRNGDRRAATEYWNRDQRGTTMLDHAIEKVRNGLIDPFAAERVVGPLIMGVIESDFRIDSMEIARVADSEDAQ